MIKLSAVIITFNEEKNIERCLQSLQGVVDEIVVVDSFSTDSTEEICKKYNVRFIKHPFEGYIEQKNWATQQAKNDYVLSLDADEALSEELKKSILKVKENWEFDGYSFNRLTNYCGHWIKHTSWYPSKKLRLWDRRKGKWDGINPHDRFVLTKGCKTKHLKGDLLHYSFYSIDQHINQINKFTEIIADSFHKRGLRVNIFWHLILHPLWRFFRDYIVKIGFLGGLYGLIVSINSAYEVFIKYFKLYKLIESDKHKKPFRICFFTSSSKWTDDEKWQYHNALKLKDKGFDSIIVSHKKTKIFEEARNSKLFYYGLPNTRIDIFKIWSALLYIKYLKKYRVASIIINNPNDLRFVGFCARMANINKVFLHKTNIEPIPSSLINRYYFHHVINKVIIDSEKHIYTVIMNNYKLITKDKIDFLINNTEQEFCDKILQNTNLNISN